MEREADTTRKGEETMRYLRTTLTSLLLTGVLVTAACEGFLEVTNPGGIQDTGLNDPVVFPPMVFGMQEDFGVALTYIAMDAGVWADEWRYAGTGTTGYNYDQGIIRDDEIGGHWNRMHRARWVAENGIERMLQVWGPDLFANSVLGIRAHLLAGFANRLLGEIVCEVVFDGGPAEPNTAAFERAEANFSEAARMAELQSETEYRHAALGARASVRAWLGNWSGAEADAAQVPVEFSHEQMYWATGATFGPGERGGNQVWKDNFHRLHQTVAGRRWADTRDDPRVPWDSMYTAEGHVWPAADGSTPWIRQMKYPAPGSDIPLVKGTELLLLRAEGQLLAGNVGGAVDLINQNRAHYGLDPVSPSGQGEAWQILKHERGAEVWLEARRFWDLRRWDDDFLTGRHSCMPISDRERRSNPNL